MKISIVTAVFNRVDTIADALRSVEAQSYRHVEHIIQDGGSKDATLELIRKHDGSSRNLVSEPDAGIYDAINKGISRATGDVIGLMHSDDFFAHDKVLERVAEAFRDPAVDGVYGDLDYVSASNTGKIVRRWRSGSYHPDHLKRGWMPPHPTLYLRREVFDRWGLYDTSMRIAADYEAMLRYLVKGDIRLAYIPEVLVKMRVGGESNRSLSRILQKSREDYIALRRHGVGGINSLLAKNFSKLEQFLPRKGIPK
ncbi:glycosyltransferase [Sulfitobacter sp. NFXS29]